MNNYIELLKDPYNLTKWVKILDIQVTKASSDEEVTNMRTIYDEFLGNFPYLVNYYIKYIDLEYQLQNISKCEEIYESGFRYLSYSIEFWMSYLKFKITTTAINFNSVKDLVTLFETARSFIGLHYFSGDFYKLYLEFLQTYETLGITGYDNLLKYVLEVPLYNYSYFHEKVDKKYVDSYITTQYKAYKLYEYEKKLTNYNDVKFILVQELKTWDKYLEFMELNYPHEFVIQLYERAVITTSQYPEIWNKYVSYLTSKGKYRQAEIVAKRGKQIERIVEFALIRDKHLVVEALKKSRESTKLPVQDNWNDYNETLSKYLHT